MFIALRVNATSNSVVLCQCVAVVRHKKQLEETALVP